MAATTATKSVQYIAHGNAQFVLDFRCQAHNVESALGPAVHVSCAYAAVLVDRQAVAIMISRKVRGVGKSVWY